MINSDVFYHFNYKFLVTVKLFFVPESSSGMFKYCIKFRFILLSIYCIFCFLHYVIVVACKQFDPVCISSESFLQTATDRTISQHIGSVEINVL